MAKKTVNVKDIVEFANIQLKRTDDYATEKFKAGICAMTEKVMRDSDSYNGYRYLDNNNSDLDSIGYFEREYYLL